MSWQQPIIWFADIMRPHNAEIALAMIATLLVIFSDHINRGLKHVVRKQPVWLRVIAFIALCSVGYGSLTIWLTPILSNFLQQQSSTVYVLTVVGCFLVVGVLAERFQRSR